MTNDQIQSQVHRAFDLKRRIEELTERKRAAAYHAEYDRVSRIENELQGCKDEYRFISNQLNEHDFKHSARHCFIMNTTYDHVWTDSNRKGVMNSCENCNPQQPEQNVANAIASMTFG